MPKFRVTGVDTQTQQVLGMEVEAESAIEARRIAAARGLRHIAIAHEPVAPEEAPPAADISGK